ncbi:hypothetical protein FRC04_003441 [Tulasnella sp. 424]|nr:hypothetical protein FRC04_003441 [Tulasnella sp. 424]
MEGVRGIAVIIGVHGNSLGGSTMDEEKKLRGREREWIGRILLAQAAMSRAMPSLTHLTLDFNFFPPLQDSQLLLPAFDSLQFLHVCTNSNSNGVDTLSILLERAPNVTSLMITVKVPTFASSGGNMITPLLLTAAASPQEPFVGKKLEEVHLLMVFVSVDDLKKLVDLRAGCLKKIVVTKGLTEVHSRPNTNPEQDLAWLKNQVTFEEVEG